MDELSACVAEAAAAAAEDVLPAVLDVLPVDVPVVEVVGVVVLVPACAIELYKPAASYTSLLLVVLPNVATMPEVVDSALASAARPGSLLETTGEAALELAVLAVLVTGISKDAGVIVLTEETDIVTPKP